MRCTMYMILCVKLGWKWGVDDIVFTAGWKWNVDDIVCKTGRKWNVDDIVCTTRMKVKCRWNCG